MHSGTITMSDRLTAEYRATPRAARPMKALVRPVLVRGAGDPPPTRRGAWIELLWDLVACAGLVQLALELARDHNPSAIAAATAMVVPVVTGWRSITLLLDRYESDDLPQHLILIGACLGAVIVAVQMPFVLNGNVGGGVLGLLLIRGMHLVYLRRAERADAAASPWLRQQIAGQLAVATAWILCLLFSGTAQLVLLGIGIAIDIAWTHRARRLRRALSPHASTIGERTLRFITLTVGAMLLGATQQSARTVWDLEAMIAGIAGFVTLATLWWLYLDGPTALDSGGTRLRRADHDARALDVHVPFLIGLVGVAAAGLGLIASISTGRGDTAARVLLCAASAVAVMSLVFIQRECRDGVRHGVERMRFGAAVLLLFVAIVAAVSRAEVASFMVMCVLLGLAAWEAREHRIVRRHYVATDDPTLRPMLVARAEPTLDVTLAEVPAPPTAD
jgi:low temperature requirement protein LtrA